MAAEPLELDESLLAAIVERRLALRVPTSLDVTVRDGFRSRRGEILDLSLTGCRVRFDEPVTSDRRPWLWIPAGLGGRFSHPIGTEVAWTDSLPGAPTGHCQVGLSFRRFPWNGRRRLQRVLAEMLARAGAGELSREPQAERRAAPRAPYDRPLVARGGGRPLVLLGRDLSATGLSVETRRALAIGDRLQVALHAGGKTPLVVSAEVVRAAGESGWALAFRDVSAQQRERLDAILREQIAPDGAGQRSVLVSSLAPSEEARPT